jgi:hypothetical protein
MINFQLIHRQSIRLAFHDAGEVNLTNSADFMGPDECISDTASNTKSNLVS